MASIIPATTLASVCRAAKPMIAAATTPEASRLAAIRLTPVELRERERDADQEDRRVDEPAHEAQPRVGLAGELAAAAPQRFAPRRRAPRPARAR